MLNDTVPKETNEMQNATKGKYLPQLWSFKQNSI